MQGEEESFVSESPSVDIDVLIIRKYSYQLKYIGNDRQLGARFLPIKKSFCVKINVLQAIFSRRRLILTIHREL